MTTATVTKRKMQITISDSTGVLATVALPGVTMFELVTLRLPPSPRTVAGADGGLDCSADGCGGGCRSCSSDCAVLR